MITCPECNHELITPQTICPQCGFNINENEEGKKALQEWSHRIVEAKLSNLDISPQGLMDAKSYIDNISKLLEPINGQIFEFIKKHDALINNPYHDTLQGRTLEINLFMELGVMLYHAMQNRDFSREVFAKPPPGLGILWQEVGNLYSLNEDFFTSLATLVESHDSGNITKAREIMVNIVTSVNNANDEIGKVLNEVNDLLPRGNGRIKPRNRNK